MKQNSFSWEATYKLHENTIKMNESNFTDDVNPLWGDLESDIEEIQNISIDAIDTMKRHKTIEQLSEKYYLEIDLQCSHHHAKKKDN